MTYEIKNQTFASKENSKKIITQVYLLFHILEQNFSEKILKERLNNYIVNTLDIFIIQTETIPGIFCKMRDAASAEKIYRLKNRSIMKPLAIYSSNYLNFAEENNLATKFLKRFNEESLTLVLKAKKDVPRLAKSGEFVGIRLARKSSNFYKFLQENKLDLLGTSANFSDKKSPKNISEIDENLSCRIIIIDLEEEAVQMESSVIKIEGENLTILREGYNIEEIVKWAELQGGKLILSFEGGEEKKTYIINKFK